MDVGEGPGTDPVRSAAEPDLVELLTTTARQLGRGVAEVLAEDGGTLEGYRVLRALAATPGATMGRLAGTLQLPAPSATRVVDALVGSALAYRLPDPDDRRRVVVHLSATGRTRLSRWESLVRAHEAALAQAIGQREMAAIVSALRCAVDGWATT